MVADKLLEKGA